MEFDQYSFKAISLIIFNYFFLVNFWKFDCFCKQKHFKSYLYNVKFVNKFFNYFNFFLSKPFFRKTFETFHLASSDHLYPPWKFNRYFKFPSTSSSRIKLIKKILWIAYDNRKQWKFFFYLPWYSWKWKLSKILIIQ